MLLELVGAWALSRSKLSKTLTELGFGPEYRLQFTALSNAENALSKYCETLEPTNRLEALASAWYRARRKFCSCALEPSTRANLQLAMEEYAAAEDSLSLFCLQCLESMVVSF